MSSCCEERGRLLDEQKPEIENCQSPQPESGSPATDRVFHVSGLCCVEEVRTLERVLGPLIGGRDHLSFDIINSRMRIHASAAEVEDQQLISAVAATGMQAQRVGKTQAEPSENPWKTRLSLISAGAWLLGSAIQIGFLVSAQGSMLVGAGSELSMRNAQPLQLLQLLAWWLAVASGIWFVMPKAWFALKSRQPDMNLLMVTAIVGALAIGELFEAATVACLFALSLMLENWSVGRARKAVAALLSLTPDTVRVPDETGREQQRRPEDISPGTRFIVQSGERIALDGIVVRGQGEVDQAPVTGESLPVLKQAGDGVFAGTINGEGTLTVQSTQSAGNTVLARIISTISEAHGKRAKVERWVDAFARRYTPAVMLLAILTLLLPPLLAGASWQDWFYNALVLLVIACPCALVIATPVSIVAALASSARCGVLVKGGVFMEMPARLDALALDKTGTLTLGKPALQSVMPLDGRSEEALLSDAAALEYRSSHPLAGAIVDAADSRGLSVKPANEVRVLAGLGVEGRIDHRHVWIGSSRHARQVLGMQRDRQQEAPLDPSLQQRIAALESRGQTVVVVGDGEAVLGLLSLADTIRAEAPAVINALHQAGVKEIVMLTGDNENSAQAIARLAGIDTVKAGLLPEDKVAEIEALSQRHTLVAMLGDGVNDAPAMARAGLGIAMGAIGSDAAIETADVALMSDELRRLPWLIHHSRRTLSVIRQNIVFALVIKAVFVIATLFGMASLWAAIVADVGATLLVVCNALRLLQAEDVKIEQDDDAIAAEGNREVAVFR